MILSQGPPRRIPKFEGNLQLAVIRRLDELRLTHSIDAHNEAEVFDFLNVRFTFSDINLKAEFP